MRKGFAGKAVAAVAVVGFGLALGMHWRTERGLRVETAQAAARERGLPQTMLWVWERPEDLRGVDARVTGVAVLRETLRLSTGIRGGIEVVGRHQPVVLPEGIAELAVVRLEAEPGFDAEARGDGAVLRGVVGELARVARGPGVAGLQVDFDATRGEQAWYRQMLMALRTEMPKGMPLEMTALVSWCSTDDWIGDLPVNAAVPMFFRMEPDRRRLRVAGSAVYGVREPLCRGSVGVSTREPWPDGWMGKRVYVFADEGWRADLDLLKARLGGVKGRAGR